MENLINFLTKHLFGSLLANHEFEKTRLNLLRQNIFTSKQQEVKKAN